MQKKKKKSQGEKGKELPCIVYCSPSSPTRMLKCSNQKCPNKQATAGESCSNIYYYSFLALNNNQQLFETMP